MRMGSPFFRWDGVVLQLTDAPYRVGNQTFVPLQFISDFLPRRLPGLYEFDGARSLLRAGDLGLLGEQVDVAVDMEMVGYDSEAGSSTVITEPTPDVLPVQPGPYEGVRVVVIDAGHGGGDPGALGPDGIREKTVALSIATRLAALLGEVAELEVHLIRDDDTFVALWERGQIATDIKGERPGIFVSIHANSFPARREARGFETYFLSDARTEHERRVSAIENAPLSMSAQELDSDQLPELDFILRDLKNYDHAHWSEELASLVQNEMNGFHPGPNRGVKQGLLAVLTNALMPSILIEVGYLSNAEEGRLIGGNGFHQDSATAIADAVARFFERYPPGSGGGESDDH
jgi:N-acetylmuramoyl-L-alanine amidase